MPAPRRPLGPAEPNSHEKRALEYVDAETYQLMLVAHAETTITGFITAYESYLEFASENQIDEPHSAETVRLWGLHLVTIQHAAPAQEVGKVLRWFTLAPRTKHGVRIQTFDAGPNPAKAVHLARTEVQRVAKKFHSAKMPPLRKGGALMHLGNAEWMTMAIWANLGLREKTFFALKAADVEFRADEICVCVPHDKVEGTAQRTIRIRCACTQIGKDLCLIHSGRRALQVAEVFPVDQKFANRFLRKNNLTSHSLRVTNALYARYAAENALLEFDAAQYLLDRGWSSHSTFQGYCAHLRTLLNPDDIFPVYLPPGKGSGELTFRNKAARSRTDLTEDERAEAEKLTDGGGPPRGAGFLRDGRRGYGGRR